jgi:rhamnosyltransferase
MTMNLPHDDLYNVKAVCAVVVSYNGGTLINDTVNALISQVAKVLIVDNHSDEETRKALHDLEEIGISVIYNNDNYGIAYALNQGVQFARDNGYQWLLTMDQDSIADEYMVSDLLACADNFSDDSKYVSFSPIFIDDKHTKESYKISSGTYQERYTVITSGNLIKTDVFRDVGRFEDKLFIDCVDFEFCLRLRQYGYKIVRCYKAQLFHSLGEVIKYNIFGIEAPTTFHTPERRYYIMRNHIYILKRYSVSFPLYCIRKQISIINLIMQVLFLERDKAKNFKYLFKGFSDGIFNRFGAM